MAFPKTRRAFRGLLPLTGIKEARQQIAAINILGYKGPQRYVALSNLLGRAYAGRRNGHVIAFIEAARQSSVKDLGIVKVPEAKMKRATANRMESLKENVNAFSKALVKPRARVDFKKFGKVVHLLLTDTPKSEQRIVARFLDSNAVSAEVNLLANPRWKKSPALAGIVMKMYSAAGELYRKAGDVERAGIMFDAIEILNRRL